MVFPLGDSRRTRIVPIVTYLLITANVLAYLVELERGDTFRTAYAATPYEITHDEDIDRAFPVRRPGGVDREGRPVVVEVVIPQGPVPFPVWLTLFTSMFLHASPIHLAGNMLFLWIFGDDVEEVLGGPRYLLFYLLCGLAAGLAQILAAPDSYLPTLGASGAIAGVMGAYLVWFPRDPVRVLLLNFITEVPAWLVIGLWIAIQVYLGVGSLGHLGEVGGVAYLAHLGGAAAGIGGALLIHDRSRPPEPPWVGPLLG